MQVLPTIRIFVASPGDLGEAGDREQVQDLVDRLGKDVHLEPRCALQCLRYDDAHRNVLFVAGQPMQQSVDDRLGTPGTCDIVIGLFWSRLGTPITRDGEDFPSGTAWELHDARHGPNKPTVLVFRREPLPAMPADRHAREALVAELDRLDAYLGSFEGTVNRYSAGRLAETVDQQLRSAIVNRLEAKAPQAAADPGTAPLPQPLDRRPYPGLLPFDADDAPLFFGRERETGDLVRRIGDERKGFTAIVGISGAGKSSLMRAGVLPQLAERGWKRAVLRPTDFDRDPRLALAAALRPLVRPTGRPIDLVERWETTDAWRTDLETARGDAPGLVLAIDQAEELFTDQIEDPGLLLRLLTAAQPTASVLLTLRADFVNAATATPPLEDLLTLNTYFIGLPPPRMLVAIIREPAARVGAEVEDRLVDALVADVGGDPGGLALLAFVLERLWELDGAGGRLRLSTYRDALGGLDGALAKHCAAVEAALDAEAALGDWRPQLRKLFAHAVQVTDDADGNRRLGKKRFRTDAEPALAALAERLRAQRLLTGADDGTARFELAHEKLLEAWPALMEWLAARRRWLEIHHDLRRDCARWLQNGRDPAFGWSHERVREAAAALDELELGDDAGLTEPERAFLGPIDKDAMQAALKRAETTHAERAFIGERLSVLGDPRDGVGVDDRGTPLFRWCYVPPGKVSLEGSHKTPPRPVDAFHIAAYPVTVAQYRGFLKAEDGWADERWWRDLERDPDGDSYDLGRFANHPAVWVSWFDASAFCRWASHRRGEEVRLPTEWEWQQAATGGLADRKYPWGPKWEPDRANTFESRLMRSTAVGMYPGGESPVGALDMAGTVWEWCANTYDHSDDSDAAAARDRPRVVRGGSWINVQGLARCAFRFSYHPINRFNVVGFRVVCSSPISSADR